MFKQTYNIIGVMSGTSLDGVDLAHIVFTKNDSTWSFEILECETLPYEPFWLNNLKQAIYFSDYELEKLNLDYTNHLGTIIKQFINKNNITNIDAVSSHGHTILHQPSKGLTLQIGNLAAIATITEQKVVCDFRVQDVALGGQGAPLVPIGDQFLFSEYDYCLNLGGFSNISFDDIGTRKAFDISPVNTVLNHYANFLGLEYDNKGLIANSGKVNLELLNQLNEIAYYQQNHPKSLGIEFVKQDVLPLIEKNYLEIEDKLATFTEHIALQIANALPNKSGKMLITGGGAYNNFLIHRMQFYLPEIIFAIPSPKVLEFKEALIFGLLGVLKLRNENNVLASVTGCPVDHCSGFIYQSKDQT